jgi:hypothetical protein
MTIAHAVAGHTLLLRNIVCVFPIAQNNQGMETMLRLLTNGGELSIALRNDQDRKEAHELSDLLWHAAGNTDPGK